MSETFDPYRKWLGIPSEEQPPHHYRLLGIPLFEADPDVIENAAHRQMVYVRTFQNGKHAELSQKLLNELAAAKVCLLTPDRKQAYDFQLHSQLTVSDRPIPASGLRSAAPFGVAQPGIASGATSGLATSASPNAAPMATLVQAPTSPPPVAAPTAVAAPVASASMTTPAALAVTSSRPHHTARPRSSRSLLWPLGLGVVGVMLVVGVVAAIIVLQRNDRLKQGGTSNATSDTVTTSDDASPPDGPAGRTLIPTANGSGESPLHREPTPANAARNERFRKQFDTARQLMAKRDLAKARVLLSGMGISSRETELKAEKEQLEVVLRFLTDFWSAVDRGVSRVKQRIEKLGDDAASKVVTFEFHGDVVELQRDDEKPDVFRVLVEGKPWKGALHDLPPRVAVPLALLGMEEADGFGRYHIATFLLIDEQGPRDKNRELGLEFYQLGCQLAGQPNVFLAAEFKLSPAITDENSAKISPDSLKIRPRLKRTTD